MKSVVVNLVVAVVAVSFQIVIVSLLTFSDSNVYF